MSDPVAHCRKKKFCERALFSLDQRAFSSYYHFVCQLASVVFDENHWAYYGLWQVKEVAPAALKRDARLSFAFVYPDRRGRNVIRNVRPPLSLSLPAAIQSSACSKQLN